MAVIGCGYLGTTHAACMAELGHDVLGIDNDEVKLAALSAGEVPFFEPELAEIFRKATIGGRLRFSSSYEEAVEFAEVIFVTVGTPQKKGEEAADLQFVDAAISRIAPLLDKPMTIIGKSTVPVGTAARLGKIVETSAPPGVQVEVAWNPEFLREGHAVRDTLRPDRIIIGVARPGSSQAEVALRDIYADQLKDGVPLIITDLATAELVKLAANAFLATKISFINAISEVCDAAGADVTLLADAIGYDQRIGRQFLNAGLGFGGGCLPKDIRAFMARAGELGVSQILTFLREVDSINVRCRARVIEMAREACGGDLTGARVAVLGAAFKPNSDDVRDSPALHVAGQLQLQGAEVRVFDPKAMENSRILFPTLHYAESVLDTCLGVDLVMLLTEWPEFCSIDPDELKSTVRTASIIDGRNCLDASAWRSAGWTYRGLGRP